MYVPPQSDPEDIDYLAAVLPFEDPPAALPAEARWLCRQLVWAEQQHWVEEQKDSVPTPTETELRALSDALPAQFLSSAVEDPAGDDWFAAARLRAWVEHGWIEPLAGLTFTETEPSVKAQRQAGLVAIPGHDGAALER